MSKIITLVCSKLSVGTKSTLVLKAVTPSMVVGKSSIDEGVIIKGTGIRESTGSYGEKIKIPEYDEFGLSDEVTISYDSTTEAFDESSFLEELSLFYENTRSDVTHASDITSLYLNQASDDVATATDIVKLKVGASYQCTLACQDDMTYSLVSVFSLADLFSVGDVSYRETVKIADDEYLLEDEYGFGLGPCFC